jgi:hypothetical protein
VYADALREYVVRHSQEEITASLNSVLEQIDESQDDSRFLAAAAQRTLTKTEW